MTEVISPWELKVIYSTMIAPLIPTQALSWAQGYIAWGKMNMAPCLEVPVVQGEKTDVEQVNLNCDKCYGDIWGSVTVL